MTRTTTTAEKENIMDQTPIYTEALTEARRRTRRHSPERARIETMNRRTEPQLEGADEVYPLPGPEGLLVAADVVHNVPGSPFTRGILDAMGASR